MMCRCHILGNVFSDGSFNLIWVISSVMNLSIFLNQVLWGGTWMLVGVSSLEPLHTLIKYFEAGLDSLHVADARHYSAVELGQGGDAQNVEWRSGVTERVKDQNSISRIKRKKMMILNAQSRTEHQNKGLQQWREIKTDKQSNYMGRHPAGEDRQPQKWILMFYRVPSLSAWFEASGASPVELWMKESLHRLVMKRQDITAVRVKKDKMKMEQGRN